MPDTDSTTSSLLPGPLRRPLWLIGTLVVPQLVLLLLNLRDWWLVAGEMTPTQSGDAAVLGGAGAALWLAGLGAALWMARRGRQLDWRHGLALLISHMAYLWAFTASFTDIVPRSIPDWMLSPGMLLYHQYGLLMPALLHGALLVACFSARRSLGVEIGRAAGVTIGIPLTAYFVVNVGGRLLEGCDGTLVFPVVLLFFAGMTALLVMGLLRLFLLLGQGLRRWGGNGRLVLVVLVGIVGPVSGLLLNEKFPFPADFQSRGVYALAVLNGLALLFPVDGARLAHRLVWLAQCALFAFTAYFMLVFLPFLPLALLAVIAMGSGLLMLVPLVLFVVHAQQLVAGWRAVRTGTSAGAWTAAGLAALLALPAGYVLRAHGDRAALNAALDHAHSPDYAQNRFAGDLVALQRGLENLRDFKAGLQLPFLSGYYNHVVFGGLVLPDEKLQSLYLTYFGQGLPPAKQDRFGAGLFGSRGRNGWGGWRSTRPPTNTVELAALDTTRAVEGDCETAVAKLVLHNTGNVPAEYVARLHLSPGVFVSGYWLHIGKERVPGRVFEKKAALWVYEMIRDLTRRDPGLLLYRDPTTVELRVFPLAAGETRTTEIEFLWPRGLQPLIQVAGQTVDTAADVKSPPAMIASSGEQGRLLIVSPPRLREQQARPTEAQPYLHVIVDASAGADPASLAARAREFAESVPGVRDVVLSAANFEMETVTPAPVPLEDITTAARQIHLPVRGGFCRDRALKCALAWHAAHAPDRPVILAVIMADGRRAVLPDEDLAYFAGWHPAARGYLEIGSNCVVRTLDFQHQPGATLPGATTALLVDGKTELLPLDGGEPILRALPAGTGGGVEITNERYRKAAAAWLRYANWLQRPAGRDEERGRIVDASRAANALTPLTSFIVVENSAQWRMLEEKENQKLGNKDQLEIQKAPEPSTWLLGAGFAAWWLARRRASRKPCSRGR